jgi:hypothetical protein
MATTLRRSKARRAKALIDICRSWMILAEQLRWLTQIEEEEKRRRAA